MPVKIPKRLQHLGTYKGFIVPYSVMWADGVPDFRVADEAKRLQCIRFKMCGICGQLMTSRFCFIGGPRSAESRFFYDPGMHYECAAYAMQVCPYLAIREKSYADQEMIKSHHAADLDQHEIIEAHMMPAEKPEKMSIVVARNYVLAQARDNDVIYVHVAYKDLERIEWWEYDKGKVAEETSFDALERPGGSHDSSD